VPHFAGYVAALRINDRSDGRSGLLVASLTNHPTSETGRAVSISSPEHLNGYLAADGINLSDDALDRIDEIVPLGVTINVADDMWEFGTTALAAVSRRR
jgi:hypothetical protein